MPTLHLLPSILPAYLGLEHLHRDQIAGSEVAFAPP